MRYVTTNIRLPEALWKSLKMEAMERGQRFSEVVRERLRQPLFRVRARRDRKAKSLYGIWMGAGIPDAAIDEAAKNLFPGPERFLKK